MPPSWHSYVDLNIRIRPWNEATGAYPVEADTGDGAHFDGELRLDHGRLLQDELDPSAYGLDLFDALFAGRIRRAYDKATGRAESETEGRLRVRLRIDEGAAELHAVPWERLFHAYRGQDLPLAATAQTPFSRYTALEMPEPPAVAERPIRLLFAAANPSNLSEYRDFAPVPVAEEVEAVRQTLGDLRGNTRYQVAFMPGCTGLPAELQARLEREGYTILAGATTLDALVGCLPGYHVLHFLGHGIFQREMLRGPGRAFLLLEKDDGTADLLADEVIVQKLAAIHPQPALVFLAACESARRDPQQATLGLAPRLVAAGIPAVVAMQAQAPMEMAGRLTKEFYRRLLEHGVVDVAMNKARNLLTQPGDDAWAIPVLFMRLREGQLFDAEPKPALDVPEPPRQPRLFGRERFLDELAQQVTAEPLSALFGLPGVGKTALALALGHHPQVVNRFPDGRAWLSLGPEPDLMPEVGRLLDQFGLGTSQLSTLDDRLALLQRTLAGRDVLLLLDDVWDSAHVRPILRACPATVHALFTTRKPQLANDLYASEKEVWPLQADPAMAMLAGAGNDAARAVQADADGAAELAETAGRLPLALHVVGRQLNRLARRDGPRGAVAVLQRELATRRDRILELHAAEPRTGIAEAEPSLEAAIALSYDDLPTDDTRRAFRRLAVFGPQPLTFDAAAMAAVWGEEDEDRAGELRGALMESRLLERQEGADGSYRYALHQVIHTFAEDRFAANSTDVSQTVLAHANHYGNIVLETSRLIIGRDALLALAWLDGEIEQIRRAITWARLQKGNLAGAVLLKLVLPLRNYAIGARDLYQEYASWLEDALSACRAIGEQHCEANILQAQGDVLAFLDQHHRALDRYREALNLFRAVGDRLGEAYALKAQSDVLAFLGQYIDALGLYQEAMTLFQVVEDRLGEASVLQAQGDIMALMDQPIEAVGRYEEALTLFRAIGDRLGEANVLKARSDAMVLLNQRSLALDYYQEALELYRAVGSRFGEASVLKAQGDVQGILGRTTEALALYQEALIHCRAADSRSSAAKVLEAQARVHYLMKHTDEARAHYDELLLEARPRASLEPVRANADQARFLASLNEAARVWLTAELSTEPDLGARAFKPRVGHHDSGRQDVAPHLGGAHPLLSRRRSRRQSKRTDGGWSRRNRRNKPGKRR